MTPLLLCVAIALALAQTPPPAAPRAAAPPPKPETIYVAVQTPPPTVTVQAVPPTVTVEAPSEWPTIVLGILGLALVAFQVALMRRQNRIMSRQTDAMSAQSELMSKQTALAEQQAAWRRDEAIGTFYRVAFDLVGEFMKANVGPGQRIAADYSTHPRQMLRDASRLFAPLGNSMVMALNQTGLLLDHYFEAVLAYNKWAGGGEITDTLVEHCNTVQSLRGLVGNNLDLANGQLSPELRWKDESGDDHRFRARCSKPPATRSPNEELERGSP